MAEPTAAETRPAVPQRRCPSGCGTLASFKYRGVALDRCEDCAGIWFDAGEYHTLDALPEAALFTLDREVHPTDIPAAAISQRAAKPRRCPCCNSLMMPFAMHVGITVTLDRCDLCDGIWADDSELATLCAALGHKPPPTIEESLDANVRQAIALASMAQMSAEQTHRAHMFQSLCAWIGRRPGIPAR